MPHGPTESRHGNVWWLLAELAEPVTLALMNRPTLRVEPMEALFKGHVRQHLIGELEKDLDLTVEHRSYPGIGGGRQSHVDESTTHAAEPVPLRSANRHAGQPEPDRAIRGTRRARMMELALNLDCVDDETRESRSAPTGAVLLVSVVEKT